MRTAKFASLLAVLLGTVVAAQAQTVQSNITYNAGTGGVAVDYIAHKVYVVLPNSCGTACSTLQVLSADNASVIATNALPFTPSPNGIAVNVVTGTVWIAGVTASGNEVVALNGTTGAILATVLVDAAPFTGFNGGLVGLVTDANNNRVFVADAYSKSVVWIDGKTKAIKTTFAMNASAATSWVPTAIAIDLATNKVHVAVAGPLDPTSGNPTGAETMIAPATGVITYGPTFGYAPAFMCDEPSENREFVTNATWPGSVAQYNRLGVAVKNGNYAVGDYPQGIDVDYTTGMVFVANAADGSISKINEDSNSVVNTVNGIDAQFVAVDPVQQKVWVGGYNGLTVLSEN